jgi:SAM-dependent methyltransferase
VTTEVTQPSDEAVRWGYQTIDARRYEQRRYGSLTRRLNLRLLELTLGRALSALPRGSLVLDAPCGTGILHGFLRGRGFRLVGTDLSPAMLAMARERGEARGYVRADLEHSPYRPGSFDAVVCTRFLMHLVPATRISVLRDLAAVTRGPVVATVCHPYTYKSFGRAVRRLLGRHAKRSYRLTRRELTAEVEASGLELVAMIPVLPLVSEVWVMVVRARRPVM